MDRKIRIFAASLAVLSLAPSPAHACSSATIVVDLAALFLVFGTAVLVMGVAALVHKALGWDKKGLRVDTTASSAFFTAFWVGISAMALWYFAMVWHSIAQWAWHAHHPPPGNLVLGCDPPAMLPAHIIGNAIFACAAAALAYGAARRSGFIGRLLRENRRQKLAAGAILLVLVAGLSLITGWGGGR